ncbi:MAG: alpha/beta hydrolase [Verrucomicrobia subdivision 3 bacterium]|nr:alpha/beta hydrolase [Limisphaerales bacterium]
MKLRNLFPDGLRPFAVTANFRNATGARGNGFSFIMSAIMEKVHQRQLATPKAGAMALFLFLIAVRAAAEPRATPEVACHFRDVEGIRVFYREAGSPAAPTLLLLHGFPSSSFYFRNLIPLLAGRYHVIAPDYPGFGHSDTPAIARFVYTFDHLGEVTEKLLQARGITNCVIYMFDYGGPVGMRVAVRHPEWIAGLVFQNANIYHEGLSERFLLKKPLWEKRTEATEAPVLRNMELDAVKFQYVHGTRHPEQLSPDGWTLDVALLNRPGNKAIQLELQADYGNNLVKYAEWQAYLRRHQPPTLVTWGKKDPIFVPEGAQAFKRDVPDAKIHLLDTGHFALEEDFTVVSGLLHDFLESTTRREIKRSPNR